MNGYDNKRGYLKKKDLRQWKNSRMKDFKELSSKKRMSKTFSDWIPYLMNILCCITTFTKNKRNARVYVHNFQMKDRKKHKCIEQQGYVSIAGKTNMDCYSKECDEVPDFLAQLHLQLLEQ